MDTISNSPRLLHYNHTSAKAKVFENGTLLGAVTEVGAEPPLGQTLIIPEIVISGSYSSNSLHHSRCDIDEPTTTQPSTEDDGAVESTSLLAADTIKDAEAGEDVQLCLLPADTDAEANAEPLLTQHDDFEAFVLNRTTSESNMLDSSVYSELQFAPSHAGSGAESGSGDAPLAPAGAPPSTANASTVAELLNSSACSRESRQAKRARRKLKSKSKCGASTTVPRSPATGVNVAVAGAGAGVGAGGGVGGGAPQMGGTYPPQYTAIYLDNPHHHHLHGGAANAMGQISSTAATSPFLGGAVNTTGACLPHQYHQYHHYQHRPLVAGLNVLAQHHHSRAMLTATTTALTPPDSSLANCASLSAIAAPPAPLGIGAAIPPVRVSFRKWFSRPSLPFVIGILALGGVACTLGGIVLGSTGLIEHSTQYLSAALLMIGIGVSLLVISGAIWRLSLPDDGDECPCYRHMETCRNCNSPFCNNRLMSGGYLYPEFQHRPPPPSYLTSLNECAAMGLLFHPTTQQAAYSTLRVNTPPPHYRSTNSLSVFMNGSNGGNVGCGAPPTTAPTTGAPLNGSANIVPDHNAYTMSAVMENLQAQTQPTTKEITYLELD